jgi:hypothetical protein
MTTRRPCPPAPGPLEDYATQFDPLLASVAQRRGLRGYLQGLLLPRDRNKTLTALADAEPNALLRKPEHTARPQQRRFSAPTKPLTPSAERLD